jgi:hypothetical protein
VRYVRFIALIIASLQSALGIVAGLLGGCYLLIWLHEWLWGILVLLVGVPTAYAQLIVFLYVLEQLTLASSYGPPVRDARVPEGSPARIVDCPQCRQHHRIAVWKPGLQLRCVACNHEFVAEEA